MQSKRKTQAEKTAASDAAMFKAAITLIAKEGPSQMTLAKVASEAGFTPGLIIHRFGSKAGLLTAVSQKILAQWQQRVFDLLGDLNSLGIDELCKISDLYLDIVTEKSDLMLALFKMHNESYSSYKEVQQYFQGFDAEIRTLISHVLRKEIENGNVKKELDIDAFAVIYLGVLRGTSMQYFIDDKSFDMEAVKKTFRALLRQVRI